MNQSQIIFTVCTTFLIGSFTLLVSRVNTLSKRVKFWMGEYDKLMIKNVQLREEIDEIKESFRTGKVKCNLQIQDTKETWEKIRKDIYKHIHSFQAYPQFCGGNLEEPIDIMDIPQFCGVCGELLQIVRPGKWQCINCEEKEFEDEG